MKLTKKIYAGIGARTTPPEILSCMTIIAQELSLQGYILRSGGAKGADSAFEMGAMAKEIYVAADCTDAALELSSRYHPNWDACSPYVKRLHGRNAMIILGPRLDDPVEKVYLWTPGGKEIGGTGQAMRIAKAHGIKMFNLYDWQTMTL